MTQVSIEREPIELFKLLKYASLVSSGGEAKLLIADGQVMVNDQIETRKRRKIMAGDVVKFGGDTLQISLA